MDAFVDRPEQAVRPLARAPLFTLTAVLSLAAWHRRQHRHLCCRQRHLLAPTPAVRDMDWLVGYRRSTDGSGFDTVSFGTYRELGDRSSVFDDIYAMRLQRSVICGARRRAERMLSARR